MGYKRNKYIRLASDFSTKLKKIMEEFLEVEFGRKRKEEGKCDPRTSCAQLSLYETR